MILNRIERWAINHPLRGMWQKRVETPKLLRLGGRCDGALALEIGGGQGLGAELIRSAFGAREVVSLDLDFAMTRRAQDRTENLDHCSVVQADCTALPMPSDRFDALFDFGVLHHVPQWQQAVAELSRVARPGARLYTMEMYRSFICHPLWRRLLEHPQTNRFSHDEFMNCWREHGWQPTGDNTLTSGMGWSTYRLRS
ncbi:class I SAM-dependent methyltransferase [Ferrimonas gelatinilytica]|uniref:Methyltransferase type 11 domain-containing protein n=1 Tax=Ferrimonas gelatinilytica TaxID=1255257 RepID=A0ABP9S160_9GAMM